MQDKQERASAENNALKEIRKTEKSYNEFLSLLEYALIIPIVVGENPTLNAIQPHISNLKEISSLIIENINQSMNIEIKEEERRALRTQRSQLLKFFYSAVKPYVDLYQTFAKELSKNPQQFDKVQAYLDKYSDKRLKLDDLLFMPLQRGPRYKLLVTAALENQAHLEEVNIEELHKAEALISSLLKENFQTQLAEKKEPYQFGDGLRFLKKQLWQTDEAKEQVKNYIKNYRPGDITRYVASSAASMVGGLFGAFFGKPKEPPTPSEPFPPKKPEQ